MPYPDCHNLIFPFRHKFYYCHNLYRRFSLIFLNGIRGSTDAQKQYHLLYQLHHAVFSIISGRLKIIGPHGMKFLQSLFIYPFLIRSETNWILIDMLNILSRHLFKCSGYHRFIQQCFQYIRLIDILRFLL